MIEWVTISLPWPSLEGWHYLQGLLAVWLLAGSIAAFFVGASMAISEVKEASAKLRLVSMGHRGITFKAGSLFSSTKWHDGLLLWGLCLLLGPAALVLGWLWLLALISTSEEKVMAGIIRRRREWLDSYMGRRS